ncbi:hypothetical protein DYB32_000622 [Aphanomyces invadans]|uniref:Uncharacterized protein n=1 Tax=Aphanomyces invadans TaxID=157072 RepID=A0A3R6W447_9STRA|nr:hypothetical protein DYB32_000622 [Aphanomyces invadans]
MPKCAIHVAPADDDGSDHADALDQRHIAVGETVVAKHHSAVVLNDDMTWTQGVESMLGFVYVIVSIAASAVYLDVLSPSLTNDLWWPDFNASGYQAFLGDMVNFHLALSVLPLDVLLLAPGFARTRSYANDSTVQALPPAYARLRVLEDTNNLEDVIYGLHANEINPHLNAQYCWVDFDRRFAIAHTAARQRRCAAAFMDNAAVYLESVLRNAVWGEWDKMFGGSDGEFTLSLAASLQALPMGHEWLASVRDAFTDIPTEAAYWRAKHATRWQLQWHNQWQPGVDERISIHNSFGMKQDVVVKKIPFANQGAAWRTMMLTVDFRSDMALAKALNRSLVRGMPNQVPDAAWDDFSRVPDSLPKYLWTRTVGPYGSIDATIVPPPSTLKQAVYMFRKGLIIDLQNNSTLKDEYDRLAARLSEMPTAAPHPPVWHDPAFEFFGGSPLCVEHRATPYPQDMLHFSDSCLEEVPMQVPLSIDAALFGVHASGLSGAATCHYDAPWNDLQLCQHNMLLIHAFVRRLHVDATSDVLVAAAKDVHDVRLIQFAHNMTARVPVLLQLPLLDATDPAWSFYGWVMLFNWVSLDREVVQFAGDVGAVQVISAASPRISYTPNPLEIPGQTGPYIYSIMFYITAVLALVAGLMLAYSWVTEFRVVGHNLFRFHRVVGSVWIGRILLCFRGLTALALVGLPQIQLGVHGGVTSFRLKPWSPLETISIHSEVLWVLYVVHDIVTPVMAHHSYYAAPLSTLAAFVAGLVLDKLDPVQAHAIIDRHCTTVSISMQISCHSGAVHFGEPSRLGMFLALHVGSTLVAYAIVVAGGWRHQRWPSPAALYLSAAAESYLDLAAHDGESQTFDHVTCVMCGLVTVAWKDVVYIFDLKSWTITPESTVANLERKKTVRLEAPKYVAPHLTAAVVSAPGMTVFDRVKAVASLGFMATSLAGSALYIASTRINMANDFWWARFNSTGTHAYLGNWFNTQLVLNPYNMTATLDHPNHSDAMPYNTSSTLISSSALYPRMVQYEGATSIEMAIVGLRLMDKCVVHEIMTIHCWADFGRDLELAYTPGRRRRCADRYVSNGAVYLESALRNIDFANINACYRFPVVFGNAIESSQRGKSWLASLAAPTTTSVSTEASVWRAHGIDHYTTQFQNFKQIGLVETFTIENAMGARFPMTLKRTKSAMHPTTQTSFKLYWPLAYEIHVVDELGLPVPNCSLVPHSPTFAYQNTSIQAVMTSTSILDQPFGPTFSTLQVVLGPFGTIDARHVACPTSMRHYYKVAASAMAAVLAQHDGAQQAFEHLQLPWNMAPCPPEWIGIPRLAGNILCDQFMVTSATQMLTFWTDGGCASSVEVVVPTRMSSIVATVAANGPPPQQHLNVTATCSCVPTTTATDCADFLAGTAHLVEVFLPPSATAELVDLAAMARRDVGLTNASLVQFDTAGNILLRPIFDASSPAFDLFAWEFAIEWALGKREVVSFEGDKGSLVLLRSSSAAADTMPNPLDIPQNVALYSRAVCVYITAILSFVAVLASMAIVASMGRVEARNVLVMNRVAGIVWTGRPLLFVRSVVALALLSTATIELRQYGPLGLMSAFESTKMEWYKVLLASGEVSWFVIMVGDVMTIFTQQYTTVYASPSGRLASVAVAVLSFVSPVTHVVSVNRKCTMLHVDYELVCNAGTVYIGKSTRFLELVAMALGSMAVCYSYMRAKHPHLQDTRRRASLLLSTGAKYHFGLDKWTYMNCVYLDRASAVITGLLCVQRHGVYYVVDIKLWRFFTFDVPADVRVPTNHPMHDRVKYAIPLVGCHA